MKRTTHEVWGCYENFLLMQNDKKITVSVKLQCVNRWSTFLVLLLVSPVLMWFIILLIGSHPCQLYNTLNARHRSPFVGSYSRECLACSSVCHLLRKEMKPELPLPKFHQLKWMISFYSHSYLCHPQKTLLMISIDCFTIECWPLCGGSLLLRVGAPVHESTFYFVAISIFLKRSS